MNSCTVVSYLQSRRFKKTESTLQLQVQLDRREIQVLQGQRVTRVLLEKKVWLACPDYKEPRDHKVPKGNRELEELEDKMEWLEIPVHLVMWDRKENREILEKEERVVLKVEACKVL